MNRLLGIGLGLLVVAGCGGASDTNEATGTSTTVVDDTVDDGGAADASEELGPPYLGPPYLGPLTFDWPTDCSVPVTEFVTKRGQTAELGWDLVLTSEEPLTITSIENLEVIELDGRSVAPEVAASLAPSLAAVPAFVVDETAQVVGFRGIDELIATLGAQAPGFDPISLGPNFRTTLENTVISKYWLPWAGLWADVGELIEARESIDDPADDEYSVLESVGTTESGHAIIVYEERLAGDALAAALGVTAEALAPGAGQGEFEDLAGERVVTLSTTTDPTNLIPDTAQYTMELSVGSEGETESREWEFGWAESDCQL